MLIRASQRSIPIPQDKPYLTPLIVPSFSSKGFSELRFLLRDLSAVLTQSYLISAYDLFHHEIEFPKKLPDILFLDSGGYESTVEDDLSSLGIPYPKPKPWSKQSYKSQLNHIKPITNIVCVSYDHARHRVPFKVQIEDAQNVARQFPNFIHEILLKPESHQQRYLDIDALLNSLPAATALPVIGVTEKELGTSLVERMMALARIRQRLDDLGAPTPIHVFGSLDPICSPLYLMSGADIFDGLTWLRYALADGTAVYPYVWAAATSRHDMNDNEMRADMMLNNIRQLSRLSGQMTAFAKSHDFSLFPNGDRLQQIVSSLKDRA